MVLRISTLLALSIISCSADMLAADLVASGPGNEVAFKGRVDGWVPNEIVYQNQHATHRDKNRLIVDIRIVDTNIGQPLADIEPFVRQFFQFREAARALVAEIPAESFKAPSSSLEEKRQCMAFNLAGSLLAEAFLEPSHADLTTERFDDLLARTHTYIAEHLIFNASSTTDREHESTDPTLAHAIGIESLPIRESHPSYLMSVLVSNDSVIATASLAATLGWVSQNAGDLPRAKSLLERRPALAVMADQQVGVEPFWEWSLRQCRRLTFQDLGPLAFMSTEVTNKGKLAQQLKQGRPIRLTIKNFGGRAIEGRQTAMVYSEILGADVPDYRLEAAQTFDIRLQPLGRQLIDLQLRYRAPAGRNVVLISDPNNDSALMSAAFVGEKMRIPSCADRLQDHRSHIRPNSLSHAVLSYAEVADNGFRQLVDSKTIFGVTQETLSLPIPGTTSKHLLRTPWGTMITAKLYVGESRKRGRQIFDAAVAEIRSTCGRGAGELVIAGDGESPRFATFTIRTISAEARLRLAFTDNFGAVEKGKYKVDLDIDALTPETE